MKSARDILPRLFGVVLVVIGLAFAYSSLSSFLRREYTAGLFSAGTAIAFCVLPLTRLSRADLGKSLQAVAKDAIATPEPLPLRVAMGVTWLLWVAGFISFFL